MQEFNKISTLYVSQTKGDDSAYGTSSEKKRFGIGPLKTVEKAFEKVAEIRRGGGFQPICIKILGNGYFFDKTLEIKESGVTVEPFNSDCLLSGGIKIENFKESEFNGIRCFGAYVEGVKNGSLNFTDFYVDGERADFTRYPENGFLYPEAVENYDKSLFAGSKYFTAKEGDFPSFKNLEDCHISFCHYWIDEHTPIESYNEETRKVTLSYKTRFTIEGIKNPSSRMEYYIENAAEMFKKPNQWYLDRKNGMVYYIPRNDKQIPESIEAYAPIVSEMININESKYIHFRGFTIANTKGDYKSTKDSQGNDQQEIYASDAQAVSNIRGTVNFEYSRYCSIESCKIENYGLCGIALHNGCNDIRISKNEFYDGGAGAISVTGGAIGSEPCEHTHHITISDNIISKCGKRYFAACGILVKHAYNNVISHNEISDLQYTAISVGWVWGYRESITKENLIEYNHIHHIGQGYLSDMGGVYLLGKQPGTIVRNNLIHDVISRNYGGWALYTDEGSSYITVENNICYNTTDGAYHQHYGCMNIIRNNIFAFSLKKPLIGIGKAEMHTGIIFEKNIFCNDALPFFAPTYSNNELAIFALESDNNIIFDICGKEPVIFLENGIERDISFARQEGLEENSILCDPLFVDAKKYDFTFKDTSVISKIGFKPIDIKNIGVREE